MSRLYTFDGNDGDDLPSLLEAVTGDFQLIDNSLIAVGALPAEGAYIFKTRYTNQQVLELSNATNSAIVNCAGVLDGKVGVVFRYIDINNYWAAYINAAAEQVMLVKVDAGVASTIATHDIVSFINTTDYSVSVTTLDDSIQVSLDGNLVIDVTNTFNQLAITAGGYFGNTGPVIESLTVDTPINTAPVADAGSDLTDVEAGTVVILDGSGTSDVDFDELTYLWEQLSGPEVTIANPTMQITSFNAPSLLDPSTVEIQLTVNDGQASSTDSVTIATLADVITGVEKDILQRDLINETNEQKLKRIGRSSLVTAGSVHGRSEVSSVVYPTENWKQLERYNSTQQNPEDENGLGYQFEDTDRKEV